MYLLIQAHEYHKHTELLDQSFRLRKRVFADQLGWDVSVSGHRERDRYDELHPGYLLWCGEDQRQLYGSVRLMPTTGPTLLYDVFRETFPDVCDLIAPGIWEGTRMCIDEDAIDRDFPDMRPDRAFCLLLLALCEAALANGINTMISNYEPHMRRVYQKAGAELDELGRSDGYGRFRSAAAPSRSHIASLRPCVADSTWATRFIADQRFRRAPPSPRRCCQPDKNPRNGQ